MAFAALVGAAYYQAEQIAKPLDQVRANLASVRAALSHGRLPGGDPFNVASGLAAEAQRSVDHAGFPFRVVGAIPFVNRPVHDTKLAVSAAGHLADAAVVARDLVTDMLGPAAAARPGQPVYGPAAIFHDGTADIRLIETLPPRFQQMLTDLQAARSAFAGIEPIPFVSKVTDTARLGLNDTTHAIGIVRAGLSASRLLPSFLGVDRPKTYFLALQNNADQRATGGAVLAYALLNASDGHISLQGGGPIKQREPRLGYQGVKLPAAIEWYLHHVTIVAQYPRISNLNFSPDFPAVARSWHDLLGQGAGVHLDGAIAIDPFAVQGLLNRNRILVPSDPHPITATDAVREIENGQYFLPWKDQQAFASQVISAAWPMISDPRPFFKGLKEYGTAFDQKHMQLWLADPAQEALIHRLGWDGSIQPGSGDYLYTTDNKLRSNKVDYYTYTTLTYDATIDASGTAHATTTVGFDNRTPPGLGHFVVGRWGIIENRYGLNSLQLGLYVPARAQWTGQAALPYPEHVEGQARVFATNVVALPGKPGTATFDYTVPNAVRSTSTGHVYQLTIQHQPLANLEAVHVRITLPPGTHVTSAPGWVVHGTVATFDGALTKDMALEIRY